MEDRKQALLLWLQAVTQTDIAEINDLRDGKLFQTLLSRVEGFSFSPSAEDRDSWKYNYSNIKDIYEQLTSFLQKNTKMTLPQQLTVMNLIQMAQGKTQESIETLLHLVFIVCIQSSIRAEVIPCIMNFPSSAQNELMMIIKDSTLEDQFDQRDSLIEEYKQTITKLQYAYNTLAQENQSLRTSLFEDEERVRKNQDLLVKLTSQNDNLNRELFEKNQQLIRHREELMIDKIGNFDQEMVEELKKELLDREQSYGQQIIHLKETVSSLNDTICHLRKSNQELVEQKASRISINKPTDHTNCISLQKHKAKVNEMLSLSKEATQKEMSVKLQNIKLRNQVAELQGKIKVLSEEVHKKQQDMMITRDDGNKLKVQFFSRIRDSLKQKLDEFQLKNRNSGPGFFENQT